MQNQASLAVYEDELDALRDAVRVLGGTKIVGHDLRPDMQPDHAGAWLKDCLNPERREKLDLSQILRVLRKAHRAGHHAPMQFIGAEIGYSVQPIEPQDENAELQRQFLAAFRDLKAIADRLERAPVADTGTARKR